MSDEELGQGTIPMMQNMAVGSIPKFDCNGEVTSLGARWKKWKRGFQIFMTAKVSRIWHKSMHYCYRGTRHLTQQWCG